MSFQFSTVFAERRKELQLTQEQIAQYTGVSRAAVSKWEKGLSYPDITLLPRLATYFNVSIDKLLGYEPQMTNEGIRKTYAELAESFSKDSFEQVETRVEQLLQEYYACFPFVLKMAQLYLNYLSIAPNQEKIRKRVLELCERVKHGSEDVKQVQEAIGLEASVHLMNGQPNEVLELLGEGASICLGTEQMIATAYSMLGKTDKAKEILQASLFQQVLNVISGATESLLLEVNNPLYFEETVSRTEKVIEVFRIENLNPNTVLVFYTKAAFGYMMQGNTDKALQMIEKYVKVCVKMSFPLLVQGDDYFYLLSKWIDREVALAGQAPRDELSIKRDLVATYENNPMFEPLHSHHKFQILMTNLKHGLNLDGI